MSKKKIILLAIIVFIAGWYLFKGYKKETSFVLIYPTNTSKDFIRSDLALLARKKYSVMDAQKLKSLLNENKPFPERTAILMFEGQPSDDILAFLKSKRIKATVFVSPTANKLKTNSRWLNVGLKPLFPKAEPKQVDNGYISFNFDDGYKSVLTNALPILKKAGYAATVFAIPDSAIKQREGYLSVAGLNQLQSEGWEIGSHSQAHEDFSKLSLKEAVESLSLSKEFLKRSGLYIAGFAFPYGEFKSSALMASKYYYDYFRFTQDFYNIARNKTIDGFTWKNTFSAEWAKQKIRYAKNKGVGLVFIFHEVADNNRPYSVKPAVFGEVVEAVKKSKLPVYSNVALLGKPSFLRQENGFGIESQKAYTGRLRRLLKKQKNALKNAGVDTDILLYPENVTTPGLIEAARREGFKLGFSKTTGFLSGGNLNNLNIKAILVSDSSILEKVINY